MLSDYDEGLPRLAFIFFAASVISLITLSTDVLALFGYRYGDPYANFIFKFHPQVYFICICFLMVCMKQGLSGLKNILLAKNIFWSLVICILCFLYVTIILKKPLTTIITTWLCPMFLLALYLHCSNSQKQFLYKICIYIIIVNALLGVYEYVFSHHVIPKNYFSAVDGELLDLSEWDFYRSVALYGHPLTATLISGLVVIGLSAKARTTNLCKLDRIALMVSWVSLPAFGGRTAIAVTVMLVFIMMLSNISNVIKQGVSHKKMILFLVGLFVTPLIILLAFDFGLFDKLIDRLNDDNGSAATRLVALQIFFDTPVLSLLLGDFSNELFNRQISFGTSYGIEVFWLAIILSWGFIVSIPLFFVLFYSFRILILNVGGHVFWVNLGFALILSSGVGLSVKSLLFSQFMTIVLFVLNGGNVSTKRLKNATDI
ncbi:VpsF family polysaccharide biosynthesis protein [Vibrio sp. TH_r3]|uniref:VpsF family polysaccharide biosynthesis protein n=1 Tax=Vibrio sp. TH_r3 TaxID=3082084 RepID=UPI0029530988|nr:VpsF family polysaccharide biosynthesis protein [Vibrio sp. TH_r3]MDV7102878.1 VpsF family polysaccharide biosynthesis protein [Vibrio sp. TH_r3]